MYDTSGYLGFTFAGHHSSEFGILVVSDGSRYHQNLSSSFNDTVTSVPGYNGSYYFGTQIGNKDFEFNCAFDDITTHTRDEIQHWLYPNRVGWLILDEAPYKKYLVKISQPINFSYLPFNRYDSHNNYIFERDILKGEFTISFFSFKEYAVGNEEFERPVISNNEPITQYMVDSGLIPQDYNTLNNYVLLSGDIITDSINLNYNIFSIYNAGNGIATADFYFNVNKEDLNIDIEFKNLENGQSYILKNFSNEEKLKNYDKYRVEILGNKREIWAYGLNELDNKVEESKTNIGGYYNQYYPKIYHTKMTQVLILTQTLSSDGDPEPTFYPVIYQDNDYLPSDISGKSYYFDELKYKWSDYMLCSSRYTMELNDILNPTTLYANLQGNNYNLSENSLIYLIYPNKFKIVGHITNFTPIYENTYI